MNHHTPLQRDPADRLALTLAQRAGLALVLVAAGTRVAHAQGPSFQGLGDLPGGSISSSAYGISPDGSVVVGESDSTLGSQGFRWAASGGMSPLGVLDLSQGRSFGECVPRDNATIFGGSTVNPSCPLFPYHAFSWTMSGGMVDAGTASCGGGCCTSNIAACSEDGSVRAGSGIVVNSYLPLINRSNGSWQAFSLVGHTGPAAFRGISANGRVAVGAQWVSFAAPGFPLTPLVWVDGTGGGNVATLPQLHLQAEANAASADGAILVGFDGLDQTNDCEAAVWTNFGMPVLLGDLPGGIDYSQANAVTSDGQLIGGFGTTAAGQEAFLWDQAHGMRRFQDVLTSLGVTTTGWRLTSIAAFSSDGCVVIGNGTNPSGQAEGWRAVLSCPARCIADVDDGSGTGTPDGGVTIDDLLYYLSIFEQGTIRADVDDGSGTGTPDGGVTIDDLLYYLFRFEQGC